MNVTRHWLQNRRPRTPLLSCPRRALLCVGKFKCRYSNEDTLSVVLPYFGEHIDKDGWSLWYSECCFPEELTQTFMSCNLIAGMFQWLDKLRKNAFVSVILFGTRKAAPFLESGLSKTRSLPFR